MKNKKLVSIVVALLITLALAGVVLGKQIKTSVGLFWSAPHWETATLRFESEQPITAVFTGTIQVRRASTGEVIFSQDLKTDCQPAQEPGEGRCGSLVDYVIQTDHFEREDLELWWRACWQVTNYANLACTIYRPTDCDITGAGCTVLHSVDGTVTIPESCRNRLEACGTVQDPLGFWRIRTFRGTKLYGICIPGLALQNKPSPEHTIRIRRR